jgi:hypothetical protein
MAAEVHTTLRNVSQRLQTSQGDSSVDRGPTRLSANSGAALRRDDAAQRSTKRRIVEAEAGDERVQVAEPLGTHRFNLRAFLERRGLGEQIEAAEHTRRTHDLGKFAEFDRNAGVGEVH